MTRCLAFFGAFNPPTLAHVELARRAMILSGRECVLFVPSKAAYITVNQGKDYAFTDEERLEMLCSVAKNRPWMRVCDWELKQLRQPRTYETLCYLRSAGTEASLLIGSDKLREMDEKWRYVEEMAREFGIVCMERGSDDGRQIVENSPRLKPLESHIEIVPGDESFKAISSTLVRRKLNELRALRSELQGLVPEEIVDMIQYTYKQTLESERKGSE